MRAVRLSALAGLLLLVGCDRRDLHIESDTSWAGQVDGIGAVAGYRDSTIALEKVKTKVCWSIHKATSAGTLHVWVEDGTWGGVGTDVIADQVTTEPNGILEGCEQ
jgi:hypothetical protein